MFIEVKGFDRLHTATYTIGDIVMKKWILFISFGILMAFSASAGDLPTLVNLGFSSDSGNFMFGFYGIDAASSKPYAEIYLVDTKKNDFVTGGIFRGMYGASLEPGWNASGAFFRLFADANSLSRKFAIDHLSQGRLTYLLVDGAEEPDKISFRDFKDSSQWEVALKEIVEDKAGTVTSSFSIEYSITRTDGKKINGKLGNPQIKRNNVKNYTINQIILGPDEKTLIFIIEKIEKNTNGPAISYMVETCKLP